jgi:hypothetical protein
MFTRRAAIGACLGFSIPMHPTLNIAVKAARRAGQSHP